MLPVQTVMIRYMVLVYRWGNGRLGAAGDWDGFAGGSTTGSAGRADALAAGCCRYRARARKGPADEGPAGPLDVSTIRFCFLPLHRNYLEVLQGH